MIPKRNTILAISGALLLLAVALLPAACGSKSEPASEMKVPTPPDLGMENDGLITTDTPEATSTPTTDTTGSVGQGGSSQSGSGSRDGLGSKQAAALEAELAAMEKALDSMSMPGDSDFRDIESGLD